MKKNHQIRLGLLLLFLPVISSADDATDTDALLTALGAYLGYDLASTDDPALKSPVSKLLDAAGAALSQQSAVITGLGAIPVNAANTAASQFVPSGSPYAPINKTSNYTFSGQGGGHAYNTVSTSGDGAVSVSKLIDQPTYQKDPISQAVLNILGTPNYSVCMDNAGNWLTTDCPYTLYNTQVTNNVFGIPLGNTSEPTFFSYDSNKDIISQLNSNTLLAPLLYTSASEQPTGGTTTTETNGLPSTNPMQDAANFVLYASYMVTPVALPLQTEYSNALSIMNDNSSSVTQTNREEAKAAITSYLIKLRVYAAQASIPIGNLYWMLSRRMPQQTGSDTSTQTSQALSEFQMATRRLVNPLSDKSNQWMDQINTASSATVLKEIALLLSEINYQLYLTRQQEERQLLTTSIMLLQSASMQQPTFDSSAVTNATTPDAATTQ